MSEWKEYKMDDVVTILGDGLHGTPKYDDNGEYYFINGSNLLNGKIVFNESTKKTTIPRAFFNQKAEVQETP